MRSCVLDASALLAFLLDEAGAEEVEPYLSAGLISSVNYTETLTRVIDNGKPLADAIADIRRLEVKIVPHDAEVAAIAASLRTVAKPLGLSLADRCCLALAISRRLPVLTGDRKWQNAGLDLEIIPIR